MHLVRCLSLIKRGTAHKLSGAFLTFISAFSPAVIISQPLFGPPQNLGPKINNAGLQLDPFLTADGKRLFFSNGADIYFSEMTDTGWTTVKKLGPQINYSYFLQLSPSVSPDGQKLYYVDAERGSWEWDIWVSIWDSNLNDWGTPQNLGPPVNTPGDELSAQIAPNGRHLYFQSIYANRDGLWVSEWDGSSWSQPMSLGWGQYGAEHPSVTADGKWLYFEAWPNGQTILVSERTDSGWGPGVDLAPQLGGHPINPFITPSGESLFFCGWESYFPGYGQWDIFVAERIPTDVEDSNKSAPLPRAFELYQNYPNPFNSRTIIKFSASKSLDGLASVTVFNLLGVPIRHLVRGEVMHGFCQLEWDGRDDKGAEVSAGLYLIQLKIGSKSAVKKAVFLK